MTVMPTTEEDIFGSWDEIERKEGLVRSELNAARPGDVILGPIDQLPDDEFPDLPFKVFTTCHKAWRSLSFEPKLPLFDLIKHWSLQ